jgi:ATP-binding cassette subfamily B protein
MADSTQDSGAASLLGDVTIEQLIAKSSLFSNLDDAGRRRLLESGVIENYMPGQVIMTEGEPGDSFFFIKTGAVEVSTQKNGGKLKLADLAAGDFFGEVSVITAQPRTATVTAVSPVVAVKFQRRKISRVLMDYPEVTKILNAKIEDRAADTIKKILE